MTKPRSRHRMVPRWTWLFLAGPILWYLYFWVVYLAAEAGCVADVGLVVTWVTVVLTGLTILGIVYYAWVSLRQVDVATTSEDDGNVRSLIRAGFLLGGMFVAATVSVGIPALVMQPC